MQVPKMALSIRTKGTFCRKRKYRQMTSLQAIKEPLGKGTLSSRDNLSLKQQKYRRKKKPKIKINPTPLTT